MTPREQGFLLLTSQLGDPDRKPLTAAQLRKLARRANARETPAEDRDMTAGDLLALGYSREMAQRILTLLSQQEELEYYLRKGRQAGCVPVTRVSTGYPAVVRSRLGLDSPGCLWAKGDVSLLDTPCVALVGSRDLHAANEAFAWEVGHQAALQGYTLVSGNARGADRTAQEACLEAGGRVIVVVADRLESHRCKENVLYLSEDSFDAVFSAQRALSRNRCIHAMGRMVFAAQADLGKGGTWDGTVKNLCFGWSSVLCFNDGSEAFRQLEQMGAALIKLEDLQNFEALENKTINLFDQ